MQNKEIQLSSKQPDKQLDNQSYKESYEVPEDTKIYITKQYGPEYIKFVQDGKENWTDRMIALEGVYDHSISFASKTLLEIIKSKSYPKIQKRLSQDINKFLGKKAKGYGIEFAYNPKNYPQLLKNLSNENPDYRKILFDYSISETLRKKVYGNYLDKGMQIYSKDLYFDRKIYQKLYLSYLIKKNVNENNFDKILNSWENFINSYTFSILLKDMFYGYGTQDHKYKYSWVGSKEYGSFNLLTTSETVNLLTQIENVQNIGFKDKERSQAFKDYFLFFQGLGKYEGLDIAKYFSDFCKKDFEKYFSTLNIIKQNKIKLGKLSDIELSNIMIQRLQNPTADSIKKEIFNMSESLKNYNFPIFGARKTFCLTGDDSFQFPITQKGKSMLQNTTFYEGNEVNYGTLKKIFLTPNPMNMVIRAHGAENKVLFSNGNYLYSDSLAKLYIERKKMGIKNDILITTSCFGWNFIKSFVESWKKFDNDLIGMPIILSETETTQSSYLSDQPGLKDRGYEAGEFGSVFMSDVVKTNNVASLIKKERNKTYKDDDLSINYSYFLPTKSGTQQVAETKNLDMPIQA